MPKRTTNIKGLLRKELVIPSDKPPIDYLMQSGLSKNHAHIKQRSTDSTGFTYLFVYLYIYVTIMKRKVMTLI